MLKAYLALAVLALGLYATAQFRGWNLFGSDATEFQRERAERSNLLHSSRSGGGGGFSGHK